MPPKKDSPSLEDSLAAMADSLSKLLSVSADNATHLENLSKQLATNTATTANLVTAIAKHDADLPPADMPTPPPTGTPPPVTNADQAKPPKILLPVFDGSAPLDWLFQADQYFRFYKIPLDQRVSVVAFHLKGDALSWYKYLHNNRLLTDWPAFTRALELRFGPSSFENHQAILFKLRQTGSISSYQTEFERVSNCVIGLSQDALLNCFVSGLRSDIQQELSLHRPTSIHQAYGLAKLIEDKLAASRNRFSTNPRSTPYTPSPPSRPTSAPTSAPLLTAPPKTSTSLPLRRLTPEEAQARRSQGLCFRCPESSNTGIAVTRRNFCSLSPRKKFRPIFLLILNPAQLPPHLLKSNLIPAPIKPIYQLRTRNF